MVRVPLEAFIIQLTYHYQENGKQICMMGFDANVKDKLDTLLVPNPHRFFFFQLVLALKANTTSLLPLCGQ